MGPDEDIKKNLVEYYSSANELFEKKQFNAATVLYYKALVEHCDLKLFNKTGKIGSNHTERFKLLEQHEPELYEAARKLFRYYRDSYDTRISPTIAKEVKERVQREIEKNN